MANLQLSMAEQKSMGMPEGFKVYSPFPWSTMNQSDSRIGMADNEVYWLENLFKDGNGKLRTIWDVGLPIYTAPTGKTIVSFFWFNISTTQYVMVFLSDGSAVAVKQSDGTQTVVTANANTFYQSAVGILPACVQSGSQYLIIANINTSNDYWLWDGLVLYGTGGVSPVVTITASGSNYSSAPTVTAYGGAGSGITATATINNGAVTGLTITNPGTGYNPSDIVQFQFAGGGSDTGAILTAVLAGNAVGSLIIISAGTGGTPGTYALTFAGGGGGSGAAGSYTVGAGGTITSVNLTAGGSGYTANPTIGFGGGSGITGANVIATLVAGGIASVTVTNGGSGFTAAPTLTVAGGGGSGATLTATIGAGAITGVTVTAAGSGYTSTPAVEIGGGANKAALAIATMMPSGISGTTLETFSGRVIVAAPFQSGAVPSGGIFNLSAPNSLVNFATSSGGLQFTSNDRFLRAKYVIMRQSNGYLYPFGDSSVSVISNIQTAGSPPTTTFNYQNVDPQVGVAWRDSVVDFGRTSLFANALGVFGLYGGAVTKVSQKIDDMFANIVLPASGGITPSSAVINIRGMKFFLMLMTTLDPTLGVNRNVMIAWNQQEWNVVTQGPAFTYIGTQEVNSDFIAWGTDGQKIYPMNKVPSASLQKKVASKLYGGQDPMITKQALTYYIQAIDNTANQAGIQFSLFLESENGRYPVTPPNGAAITLPLPGPPDTPSKQIAMGQCNTDPIGSQLGFLLTSNSPDFDLLNVAIGYVNAAGWFG